MHLTLICQECINVNYAADTTLTLYQHHMDIHIGTLKAEHLNPLPHIKRLKQFQYTVQQAFTQFRCKKAMTENEIKMKWKAS